MQSYVSPRRFCDGQSGSGRGYSPNDSFFPLSVLFHQLSVLILSSPLTDSDEGNANQLQAWTGPEGSRKLRLPEFPDSRHKKVVRFSSLSSGCLYPRAIVL